MLLFVLYPTQHIPLRVVSRGKLDTLASDFGGLEVFGGASIAATDPYTVMDAIQAQIQHTVSQVRSV